jgi:predicted ester cyclase
MHVATELDHDALLIIDYMFRLPVEFAAVVVALSFSGAPGPPAHPPGGASRVLRAALTSTEKATPCSKHGDAKTMTTHVDAKELCVRSMHLMADGTLADFEAVLHPDARNREDVDEPPASRGRGPAAFYATALWLRDAYADLRWEVHDVVAESDLVVVHATMSGRHVRTFVEYGPDARPAQAFPPTGKRFATTQTHWFRIADGKIIEHWANRDDLGTGTQLGWIPPSPAYLVRMALATHRARRKALR